MNAFTASDLTMYPFSTTNEQVRRDMRTAARGRGSSVGGRTFAT